MPSRSRCFAVLCLLLGWSHLASAQDAVFSSGFELRGLNPRSGALVELRSSTEALKAQTVADAQGSFAPFPASTIAAGDFLVAYGGEWQGIAPTGELRLLLDSPSAPQQLNAVTTLVTAVAASELVTGTTPAERLGSAVSYLTARALIDSDWRNGSPSRVVGPSAATLEAVGGAQNWAAAIVADLADGDLAAEWLPMFPQAHGGILGLQPQPLAELLREDSNSVQLTVLSVSDPPAAGWTFSLQGSAPAWASVSAAGVLTATPPAMVALGEASLQVRITNPASSLSRDISVRYRVVEGTVVASAVYGATGGTLWVPDNSVGIRVQDNSFSAPTTVQWVQYASGGEAARVVRTLPADRIFMQAPTLLQNQSSQARSPESFVACVSALPRPDWGTGWFLKGCQESVFATAVSVNGNVVAGVPSNRIPYAAELPVAPSNQNVRATTQRRVASALAGRCNPGSPIPCTGKTPVLFLHGYANGGNFGGGEGTWGKLPEIVERMVPNSAAYEFRYRSNARFQDIASDLKLAVDAIFDETGQQKVHIVAHSFGGLVARTYLQGLIATDPPLVGPVPCNQSRHPKVASLTTVGTPHSGISGAPITLHGQLLPNGTHDIFGFGINACKQLTCWQAGESNPFDNAPNYRTLYGVEATPGFIPAQLSKFQENALPVPTQVLIGLAHVTGGTTYDQGDSLISYQGQRFSPVLACPGGSCSNTAVTANPLTLQTGHCVYERILGNTDSATPPLPGSPARRQSMFQHYQHSEALNLYQPSEPRVVDNRDFFFELNGTPNVDMPKHDLVNRLRDWIARTHPDPVTRRIRIIVNNTGAVEVDNAGSITRCDGSVPTNCDLTVGQSVRIRAIGSLFSISPSPCTPMTQWCDWRVGPYEQVEATFSNSGSQPVKVAVTGGGEVTINPGNRVCRPGSPCNFSRITTEALTLTANSMGGSFLRWTGSPPCAALGNTLTCTLPTIQGPPSNFIDITANFTAAPPVTSRRLNDTGQNWCANNTTGNLGCPQSGFPDQDGDHGRDAQARAGALVKIGGGEAGFDYTKISNSGNPLPVSAALGSGPNDWGCTRDNVTGLIWEVKTNNPTSLRHMNHTYTWYSTDANVNGGNPGSLGFASNCNSTLPQCNTQAYVAAVNAQGLCGANDWRMPTPQELQGIVHYGRSNPAIDPVYFINTATVWTGRSWASSASFAWGVSFVNGVVNLSKSNNFGVRLVRAGQ